MKMVKKNKKMFDKRIVERNLKRLRILIKSEASTVFWLYFTIKINVPHLY